MAITILNSPNTTANFMIPAYSPFYWRCSSSNSTQDLFSFVVQVYTGTTTAQTAIVATYKPLPRPDGALIFSPNRILENFVSYDRDPSVLGSSLCPNSFTNYTLSFGEEYQVTGTTTGVTTYTGLTNESGFTFNGVLQYEDIPSWNPATYLTFNSNKQFLTNQPSTVKVRNTTDRATLQFNNRTNGTLFYSHFKVTTYQSSGGTMSWIIRNPLCSATTTMNMIQIGTGPYNLNNLSAGNFSGISTTRVVNLDTDYQYTVNLLTNTSVTASETQTYEVDQRCTKYSTVRLMFLNRKGGFDYFNFNLVSRSTLDQNKNTYRKVLTYDYNVGDRGNTVINVDAQVSKLVNSDWIDDEEAVWLQELFSSNEVYELQSDGVQLPIVIDNGSKETQKTINNQLFNISFTYKMAYKTNIQRG